MKKSFRQLLPHFALLLLVLSACNKQPELPLPVLLPKPNQYTARASENFAITKATIITYSADAVKEAQYLHDLILDLTGLDLVQEVYKKGSPDDGSILLNLIKGNPESEAYTMAVEEDYIWFTSDSNTGLFYGIQTLRQILHSTTSKNDQWIIPGLQLEDHPRFKHRGMLLDCARHFMDKDFVKRYIDLLAYHKMNVLHWHLTEDQGWRIQIDAYPKLTEVGAYRTEADGTVYGGFYTKDDIREIVAYAESLHVLIIPEIELPGHSSAAIASYPWLSCTGNKIEVENEWGVFKDVYCAGNDSVFSFLEAVMNEVVELFPGPYIHIGGDEAPKIRWKECSKCQARLAEESLGNEHELQTWFINRMGNYLKSKGKDIIGWDEILEGGIPEGAIIQSWRGVDGGIAAVRSGHEAIMSPTSHAYFDYDVKAIDLKKVYSFNPIPAELNAEEAALIRGAECNMWTERAPQETVDSKMFPRMLAMAEVLWTADTTKNFADFRKRMKSHVKRLDAMGVKSGLETNPVSVQSTLKNAQVQIELLPGIPELHVFYSYGQQILKYEEPIQLPESGILSAQAFTDVEGTKPYGDVIEAGFAVHKGLGKEFKLNHAYSPSYTGGGDNALFNANLGSLDFRDGNWQALQERNMDTWVDLGDGASISELSARFYQYSNSWIFLPTEVEYLVSNDAENWQTIATVKSDKGPDIEEQFVAKFSWKGEVVQARFFRMIAKNIGFCPSWHDAAGSPAWLFCDEFVLR